MNWEPGGSTMSVDPGWNPDNEGFAPDNVGAWRHEMELQEMITELEQRCPGCSFNVEPGYVKIKEYGRGFTVDLGKLDWTAKEWFEFELTRRPVEETPPLRPVRPDEKYRILCPRCGPVVIGYGNYFDQMNKPNKLWYCPRCGGRAAFDDENYENYPDET